MLSDAKARKLKPDDKPVSDGTITGLYLVPGGSPGNGKWILRFLSPTTGKRREMGLGSYPTTSIREARTKAFEARGAIDGGNDPLEVRRKQEREAVRLATVPTFAEAAHQHHADKAEGFGNKKHRDQWISTLERFIFPRIGKTRVNELGPADFAACLKSIWLEKPETASRVKQRCDAVMNWAAANGFIVASPVGVVDKILPKQPGKRERVQHQPALPWKSLPTFFKEVLQAGETNITRQMLELVILTACRSGELRHMEWQEIDFSQAIWTVPAARMKAKAAHRVPLGPRAIEILEGRLEQSKHELKQSDHGVGLVFQSRTKKPVTDVALTKFLHDHDIESDTPGRNATAHGFRSSFRDWASENGYPRDLAERALAHTVKNAVEAAYHRTDLLEQRRPMMLEWERYCIHG
ncbi:MULTISPECIES: tyrosine-type recombinase/integrase [unclassified Rhizobium]|uniref:tyrosine-type recombinase/integrase n=1 Tax=unclassified Rhizobium TaxID=2613769 RepID=UPI00177CB4F0|nr:MULTISPECIES: site-specific integrase [unclassified Rhizobium]MBD8689838.1 tyrosine-type recombinase/integrase [Rhizobium sp. CFBP 13644]MBD8694427.1 tyrosine-type recombinase/integrase [Rhizobium sp. CFBP 13717]